MTSDFNRYEFGSSVEEDAYPDTFGPAIPIYKEMLEKSGLETKLKKGNPRVMIIGTTSYSANEFTKYIKKLNPNAQVILTDIARAPKEKGALSLQSDGRQLALSDKSVDAIFTNLLMHWVKTSPNAVIQEAYRVLKIGGGILMLENDSKDEALKQAHFVKTGTFVGTGTTRIKYLASQGVDAEAFYAREKYGRSFTGGKATWGIK